MTGRVIAGLLPLLVLRYGISGGRSGISDGLELIRKIQTEITDAGRASGNAIIGAVEHSSGDFIEALKEEVTKEAAVMDSVGELLTAMAEYILSASSAFASVDAAYDTSKV